MKRAALMLALPLAMLGGGCATTGIADTSCQSFMPIAASGKDTVQTKRQVVAHNRVFDRLCTKS
jgi:hypothetical protein